MGRYAKAFLTVIVVCLAHNESRTMPGTMDSEIIISGRYRNDIALKETLLQITQSINDSDGESTKLSGASPLSLAHDENKNNHISESDSRMKQTINKTQEIVQIRFQLAARIISSDGMTEHLNPVATVTIGETHGKTETLTETHNPYWQHVFNVTSPIAQIINIHILHEEISGSHKFIGEVNVPIRDVLLECKPYSFGIYHGKNGNLTLRRSCEKPRIIYPIDISDVTTAAAGGGGGMSWWKVLLTVLGSLSGIFFLGCCCCNTCKNEGSIHILNNCTCSG